MTHSEFCNKFHDRVIPKYSLGDSFYDGGQTEIKVVCSDHGQFVKKAYLLLSTRNIHHCPQCYKVYLSKRSKDTQDSFIVKVHKIFGTRYDFNDSQYVDSVTKVKVICAKHGSFFKTPNVLINTKSGCPKCGRNIQRETQVSTNKALLQRALRELWPTYNIDLTHFKNSRSTLNVTCPDHGVFSTTSSQLTQGRGCRKCGIEKARKSRKLTNKQFVEKCQKIHGDLYTYDRVEYVNARTHVAIGCKKHGYFLCKPTNHIHLRRGCPECRGRKSSVGKKRVSSVTQSEFLNRANNAHSHSNYDFTESSYLSQYTKVNVTCCSHGVFQILPYNLWRGSGCPVCARYELANKQRLTKREFISRSLAAHSRKYDYSMVEYKNSSTHVTVKCYQHGSWVVLPSNHISGNSACPICARIDGGYKKSATLTKDTGWFIYSAEKVHGEVYDYTTTQYKGSNRGVKIICRIHGEFKQVARTHLIGKGCQQCGNEQRAQARLLSEKELLQRFFAIHGDRYNYSLLDATKRKAKINIVCIKHGSFMQSTSSHLEGKGCPKCSLSKGETAVAILLEKYAVEFEVEFPIRDGIDDKTLRFDFYVPTLNTLIEFDGEQHFRPVTFGGMSKEKALTVYLRGKERDNRKNDWATRNGYKLVRIKYNDNISKVLQQEGIIPTDS